MHDHIDNRLLERYCAGDCTPTEREEVDRWIAAEPSRAAYAELLKAAWQEAGVGHRPAERPDVRTAWETVERRIGAADRPPLRIAVDEEPRRMHRGWRRMVGWRVLATAAAMGALIVAVARLWMVRSAGRARSIPMSEVATQRGQRATVRLPDGTQIVLGPASRLRYPVQWMGGPRRVELDGAAYFTVTHDSTRPFTVLTMRGVITDLGTRFTVRAYGSDPAVAVAVAEGKVALETGAAARIAVPERLELTGGDLGRIAADGRLAVERAVGVEQYVAWTEGRLVFHDTPLGEAARELSRWYDLDVRLADSALMRKPLTASFKDEPAAEVLRLVAASLGLRLEQRGQVAVLSR